MSAENYSLETAGRDNRHVLKLFISGMSPKSIAAIENLRQVSDKYLQSNFDLEIIDVHQQSLTAFDYQILATPCLIKFKPEPKRIILGDLSDIIKLLKALDIEPDKDLG